MSRTPNYTNPETEAKAGACSEASPEAKAEASTEAKDEAKSGTRLSQDWLKD